VVTGWALGTSKDLYFYGITRDKRSIKLRYGGKCRGNHGDLIAISSRVSIYTRGKGQGLRVFVLTAVFCRVGYRLFVAFPIALPIAYSIALPNFLLWVLTRGLNFTLSEFGLQISTQHNT